MNRTLITAVITLITACTILGCGTPRRFGDDGGTPTTFTVELDRAYARSLSDRQIGTSVGVGASAGSGGMRSTGVGVGLSFSSTQVYLLAGDGPTQGQVFRQALKWGANTFTVPLTPGRTLHLTANVSGGYEGWEGIGEITIPTEAGKTVAVSLLADKISATVE